MSLPYYKRFPRDFLEGCVGMPFELRAGYGMILDLIYLKDGRLPLDKPWIAGHLGCSVRMFTKILDGLVLAGKLTVTDGVITNERADKLVEETRKYRDNQAETASPPRKNKALEQPKPSQSDTDSEREGSLGSKEEPRRDLFEDDPGKTAWGLAVNILTARGKMKEGAARGFFGKLIGQHKITAPDMLPALGQAIANQTQDPVAYLTKAAAGVGKRKNPEPGEEPLLPGQFRTKSGTVWTPDAWQ